MRLAHLILSPDGLTLLHRVGPWQAAGLSQEGKCKSDTDCLRLSATLKTLESPCMLSFSESFNIHQTILACSCYILQIFFFK